MQFHLLGYNTALCLLIKSQHNSSSVLLMTKGFDVRLSGTIQDQILQLVNKMSTVRLIFHPLQLEYTHESDINVFIYIK